jgi:phosphatidylinositol alpha-1,6-mannosyltransferase
MLVSVLRGDGFGGIPIVNQLILETLRRAGHTPLVVSLHDRPADPRGPHEAGVRSAGGSRLAFLAHAARASREGAVGTVLVTHIALAPVGLVAKWLSGGRLVVFLHGVEAWGPLKRLVALSIRHCDRFVANSRFTYERFLEENPAVGHIEAETCYLPARDLAPAGARAAADSLDSGRPRVLIVGRLWGRGLRKGQRQLIAAWPSVLVEFPDAELCVVGGGSGIDDLRRQAASLGVAGRVRFTGDVPDAELSAWYARSDVFAMPSRGEGFGLVFAEAMSYELPCIASRFDAGSEVVVDGETGLVVDPDDPEELLSALRALLGDERLRRRLGRAGKLRAADLFSVGSFDERIRRIVLDGECCPA